MGTGQNWVELLSGLFSSPGLSNHCPQVLVSPTNPANGWGPGIELDDPFTTDAGYQTVKCNTAHGIHLSHWPEETKHFLITIFQKMPQKTVPKTLEPFPDGFFEEGNFNLL